MRQIGSRAGEACCCPERGKAHLSRSGMRGEEAFPRATCAVSAVFPPADPTHRGRIAPWISPNRRAATFCVRQGASGRPMAGQEGTPTLPHKNIWCAGEKTHRFFGGAAMRNWIIACIRRYQRWKSPLHARCRFEPTCSEYMALAVQKYGALRGLWMGMKRISRCRPPHGGIEYP